MGARRRQVLVTARHGLDMFTVTPVTHAGPGGNGDYFLLFCVYRFPKHL
jgi:hypothetical protein